MYLYCILLHIFILFACTWRVFVFRATVCGGLCLAPPSRTHAVRTRRCLFVCAPLHGDDLVKCFDSATGRVCTARETERCLLSVLVAPGVLCQQLALVELE